MILGVTDASDMADATDMTDASDLVRRPTHWREDLMRPAKYQASRHDRQDMTEKLVRQIPGVDDRVDAALIPHAEGNEGPVALPIDSLGVLHFLLTEHVT